MKTRILLAIILGLIIIIGFWFLKSRRTSDSGSGKKAVSQEKQEKLPLDISLRYIQGDNGQGSLLKIRLFSRKLLQQDIDNKVLPKDERKEIEPLIVTCPGGFWSEGITVMLLEEGKRGAEHRKLETEIRLIRTSGEKKLAFSPGRIYEALYEIPPSVVLHPGTSLWVEATFGNQSFRSNDVVVPEPPTDEKERLLQAARVFINLENADELLRVGEELISSFPDDPSGYWFKGMVLESTGNVELALAAYEQALKNFPPSMQEGNVEPPIRLAEKINKLKQALKNNE